MSQFKQHEPALLAFAQEEDLTQEELIKRVKWKSFLTRWLNHSPENLELGVRLSNLGTASSVSTIPLIIASMCGAYGLEPNQGRQALGSPFLFLSGYLAFIYVLSAAPALASAKLNNNLTNFLQEHLIGLGTCTRTMGSLYQTITSGSPAFQKHKANFKPLADLLAPSVRHSGEFNELLELLNSKTFKGNPSFFSLTGKVLRAYDLTRMPGVIKQFGPALNCIGELDGYLALAKKMVALKEIGAPTCFVRFVTDSSVPVISARGFWNLFVQPEHAVPNDIDLGNNAVHGMILTGPNTGGKSTTMKAVMLNQLFAQTFGIALAQEYRCTPFANLNCYLNITDNTGGGISGLKAEVLRAKELVQAVKQLKDGEFAFIILDEIFTATSPDQAAKLAHKFVEQLAQSNKAIFIDATHFKELIDIEQQNERCKNYHMDVVLDENGKVQKYTYKLAEGPSSVQNAEQVAQEEDVFDL